MSHRPAHLAQDLTQGSIPRNLWSLSWPSMISGLLQTADLVAELILAGFLGHRAIASIGVAQGYIQLFNSLRMGVDTANQAIISRAMGARDFARANHVASQGLAFNFCVAAAMAVIGNVFTDLLLRVLGISPEVAGEAESYMRLRFISTTMFGLLWSSSRVLQAAGDAITPMKAQLIARLLHIALMPIFVFGWVGLPAMGLPGMAVSSIVGQGLGACLTYYTLLSGKSRIHPSFRGFRPDFPLFGTMVRIGAPASVTSGERSLAEVVLIGIVAPFGDTTLAAYSLTHRLQMFVTLGQMGVGQAAGVLTGQNLGAQHVDRARSTIWWSMGYSTVLAAAIGGPVLLFPEAFLTVFTREEHLLQAAVPWLQISVFGFMAMGIGQVFMQVFNTAGDTVMPMLVTLGSLWGVQQPAALLLSAGPMGELGIAWAMVIAMTVRLIVYFPYFWWGPWWKKRV